MSMMDNGAGPPPGFLSQYAPYLMQAANSDPGSAKRKQANAGILGQMLPSDSTLGQVAAGYGKNGVMGAASPLLSSGAASGAGAGAADAAAGAAGAAEAGSALGGIGAALGGL